MLLWHCHVVGMDMTCQVDEVDVTFLFLQVCKSNNASEAIARSNRRRLVAIADAAPLLHVTRTAL